MSACSVSPISPSISLVTSSVELVPYTCLKCSLTCFISAYSTSSFSSYINRSCLSPSQSLGASTSFIPCAFFFGSAALIALFAFLSLSLLVRFLNSVAADVPFSFAIASLIVICHFSLASSSFLFIRLSSCLACLSISFACSRFTSLMSFLYSSSIIIASILSFLPFLALPFFIFTAACQNPTFALFACSSGENSLLPILSFLQFFSASTMMLCISSISISIRSSSLSSRLPSTILFLMFSIFLWSLLCLTSLFTLLIYLSTTLGSFSTNLLPVNFMSFPFVSPAISFQSISTHIIL